MAGTDATMKVFPFACLDTMMAVADLPGSRWGNDSV